MVYATYGGAYLDAQQKAWFDPFLKDNPGFDLKLDPAMDQSKLAAMVRSGNVSWDMVNISPAYAFANPDLLHELDCDVIPCSEVSDSFRSDNAIGFLAYSTIIAYRTDRLKTAPETWADFFDVKRFPGKRGVYSDPTDGTFELALLADGVKPEDLYPIDVDRALRKYDTIRDSIVWWKDPAQGAQLIADGEVALAMLYNGRAVAARDDGAPVAMSWNQNLVTTPTLAIPKGAKNPDGARKLISYIIEPENNARFASHYPYGGAADRAKEFTPEKIAKDLPTAHGDQAIKIDYHWWAENLSAVNKKFQAWLIA